MTILDNFLDILSSLDIFGFVARAKDPTFPVWKLIAVTTVIGLVAIFAYYYFTGSKTERFIGDVGEENDIPLLANNVLRIFYTNWCGYCQKSKGDFERLVEDYNGKTINGVPVSVVMVDGDKNPDLTKEFGVEGYPSIVLQLANGQRIDYKGDRSYADLVSFLQNSIPNTQIVN
jgi:thiol-disulfide isomerase/thioredoxin